MMPETEGIVNKALKTLSKEYIAVGKTRVRSWHAWLIIGLCAGITVGIIFVANRSGEFEASHACYDVWDDFRCYPEADYWSSYDLGIGFVEPYDFAPSFDNFDFNNFNFDVGFDFENGIMPQDFDIAAIDIGELLDDFTAPIFNAFYPAEGEGALDIAAYMIINCSNNTDPCGIQWLDENVCSRLSDVGVPENQCGVVKTAQLMAQPEDFRNAGKETIKIIMYDPQGIDESANDSVIFRGGPTNFSFNDINFSQVIPGDQPVNIKLQIGDTANIEEKAAGAYGKISSAIISAKEQFGPAIGNDIFEEKNELTVIISSSENFTSNIKNLVYLHAVQTGFLPEEAEFVAKKFSEKYVGDGVMGAYLVALGTIIIRDSPHAGTALIHEIGHVYMHGRTDDEAVNIYKMAETIGLGLNVYPLPPNDLAEEWLVRLLADLVINDGGAPDWAFKNSQSARLFASGTSWLIRKGYYRFSASNKFYFNSSTKFTKAVFFKIAEAQSTPASGIDLISNTSFGEGMFKLPDVGAINSAADTGLTFAGAINPATSLPVGGVGLFKISSSANVISEASYLIKDISTIALKISEFGVEQAKKYAAAGKEVAAQDQAAGAASILVALDDYARFSKEAEEAIKAYANAPGSKDVLEENPRFLKTAFISSAQLKKKAPSTAEAKKADVKARMFFTAAQYLSSHLSAISTLISYQASMEQYFNIQTVSASVYTERSKKLGDDTSKIAGNKTAITSAKTNAAASVKTANAIYARINKKALAKKTPAANAIKASALAELNKIKSASASITSAATRAASFATQSTSVSNAIKKTVATLPSLISDLQRKTSDAIYSEAILIGAVRTRIADSIVRANKLASVSEPAARSLASNAIVDLRVQASRLDPRSLKDTKSLAYYYWSVSLGELISLKKNSVEPVMSTSKTTSLPGSFKKMDGFVASSNTDLGAVNKSLADIAASMQLLQNFEAQMQ